MTVHRSLAEFLVAGLLLAASAACAAFDRLGPALAFAAPCVAIVVAGSWRTHGLLHPLTLTLLASSAYVAAGPFELIAFPDDGIVSRGPMAAIFVYGLLFLVFARFSGDAAGAAMNASRRLRPLLRDASPGTSALWLAAVSCIATSAAVAAIYGIDIGSITRADIYANEQSGLSAARSVTAALLVIGYAAWRDRVARGARTHVVVLACFVAGLLVFASSELLVLGDRRLLLSTALGIACAHGARRVPAYLPIAGAAGAILLLAYGFVRNRPPEEWSAIFDSLDAISALRPSNMEFGGFLVVAEYVLSLPSIPDDFPGYASALLQVFPRSILPDRPEAPSEWFIRTFFPDLAVLGYGYGFNAIVESVANFGVAGPALVGAVVGALLAMAGRGRLTAGLAAFLAVFLMRLDVASLMKTTILASIALAATLGARLAPAILEVALRGDRRDREAGT